MISFINRTLRFSGQGPKKYCAESLLSGEILVGSLQSSFLKARVKNFS